MWKENASVPTPRGLCANRVFRRVVLAAYDCRCAITGHRFINGGGRAEVEAAHIKPVEHSGPDAVTNGLALSGTAHWMFDRGLIGLSNELEIIVSLQVYDVHSVSDLVNRHAKRSRPTTRRCHRIRLSRVASPGLLEELSIAPLAPSSRCLVLVPPRPVQRRALRAFLHARVSVMFRRCASPSFPLSSPGARGSRGRPSPPHVASTSSTSARPRRRRGKPHDQCEHWEHSPRRAR